jgi:hypothetical protein
MWVAAFRLSRGQQTGLPQATDFTAKDAKVAKRTAVTKCDGQRNDLRNQQTPLSSIVASFASFAPFASFAVKALLAERCLLPYIIDRSYKLACLGVPIGF